MPLPNIFKNIIGDRNLNGLHSNNRNHGNRIGQPGASQLSSRMSTTITSNHPSTSTPQHKKSLSQISGLHSHRNLKTSHQMLLAESMYDSAVKISFANSCFSNNFQECLRDNYILFYFVQFMESLGSGPKNLIKCFLQSNCLMVSVKENGIDFEETDILSEDQNKFAVQFILDFERIFNKFIAETSDICVQLDDRELYTRICLFFDDQTQDENANLEILHLFYLFWKYLFEKIQNNYYEMFLRSNFFLKYELEVLESSNFNLLDILNSNTQIASVFFDFMNNEGMKTYVDYLLMYKNFKIYSCHYSDALAIYNRFFNCSNQSSSTFLQFSDTLLEELRNSIKEANFSPDCFDKVSSILIQYFSKTYLPQFFQSNIYSEHLQSCYAKLNSDKDLSRQAANHHHNHQQDFEVKKLAKQDSISSSHSNDVLDTDSLWKRDLKGQLQFTYIDKYGRMNSLLEPEPTKSLSSGEKLSQVIKKFAFNSLESKEDEEDKAWRIAESIINDVCSVTIDHETK